MINHNLFSVIASSGEFFELSNAHHAYIYYKNKRINILTNEEEKFVVQDWIDSLCFEIDNHQFYTLYGHLSLESIQKLYKGQVMKKGEQIGTLGKVSVNGDYAPHLHFQIIKDIQDKEGDYPGVCSISSLSFYLSNCPDPNLLLKINS